jgi:hypothetical protein
VPTRDTASFEKLGNWSGYSFGTSCYKTTIGYDFGGFATTDCLAESLMRELLWLTCDVRMSSISKLTCCFLSMRDCCLCSLNPLISITCSTDLSSMICTSEVPNASCSLRDCSSIAFNYNSYSLTFNYSFNSLFSSIISFSSVFAFFKASSKRQL